MNLPNVPLSIMECRMSAAQRSTMTKTKEATIICSVFQLILFELNSFRINNFYFYELKDESAPTKQQATKKKKKRSVIRK